MDDRFQRYEEDYYRGLRSVKTSSGGHYESGNFRGSRGKKLPKFRNRRTQQNEYDPENAAAGPSRDSRSKIKHPPHLKGKAVGLFYARLSRARKEARGETQEDKKNRVDHKKMEGGVTIFLDGEKEQKILAMLQALPSLPGSSSNLPVSSSWGNLSDLDHFSASVGLKTSTSTNDSVTSKYHHIPDSHFKRNFLRSLTEPIDKKIERLLQNHTTMVRSPSIDKKLKEILLNKKENSSKYIGMYECRKRLPSFQMQESILELIRNNQVVLISGETGCGKTTQVAQFILDDYILRGDGSLCRILCTQPRRISATSVAERVASERDENIGEVSVGYQIRLEKAIAPKQGSILYCTTGILLEWMQSDPALADTSHIILDEIHERDTVSDFVITLLKDILPKRPDLKLILMSATLNADHFSRYFNFCPSINIPGFTFPVDEYYLEDVIEFLNFRMPPSNQRRRFGSGNEDYAGFIAPFLRSLEKDRKYSRQTIDALRNPDSEEINYDLLSSLLCHICQKKPDGAILVFLPGWEQISKLNNTLSSIQYFKSSRVKIIPLHSLMPTSVQKSVFDRPPPGVRKLILATNIAETSITIDDVVYVVDSGKIKMKNYDIKNNIQTLKPEWVSLANAKQRRGRAGRVKPGICYHLFSRGREMTLQSYPLPEMLRSRLDEVIIRIKMLQLGSVRPFLNKVMNPPDPLAVDHSLELLKLMNVLDLDESLTPLGYHLGKLPVDPQTGKMLLLGALFSCVDPVCSLAASLSFKDAFMVPLGKEKEVDQKRRSLADGCRSDHLLIGDVLMKWEEEHARGRGGQFCWDNYLSQNTLTMLRDMKKQFVHHLHDMKFLTSSNPKAPESNFNSNNRSLVKAIICAGLYPNVAYLHKCSTRGRFNVKKITTPQDGKVVMHPKSVNEKETHFPSPFFVYHLKLKSSCITLHDTTMVYPLPLMFFGESLNFYVEYGQEKVAIGEHLHVRCKKTIASIVMELRERLDHLLECTASHPAAIHWENKKDPNPTLLRAIVELITYEDAGVVLQDSSDESDTNSDVIVESISEGD